MIGETPLTFIIGPLAAYLIGSVPFAYIVARVFGGIDIREQGSGNVGATNVGRAMGWRYGVPVFLLDALKGFVPVYLAIKYSGLGSAHPLVILCGAGAIVGHVFPLYLRFKGGKAAATSVGVFLVLAPKVILGTVLVWCVVVAVTRYVSLGTMSGAIAFCALFMYIHPDPLGEGRYLLGISVIIALLVIFRHKGNIKRLLSGTEPKLGQGGTAYKPPL